MSKCLYESLKIFAMHLVSYIKLEYNDTALHYTISGFILMRRWFNGYRGAEFQFQSLFFRSLRANALGKGWDKPALGWQPV